MASLSRQCAHPTPDGPCRHPVVPPRTRCWQHDGAYPTIKLDAPPITSAGFWEYKGCVLRAVSGPRMVECMLHGSSDEWDVAESLGAEPPCERVRSAVRAILVGETQPEPDSSNLLPLANYLLPHIPDEMKEPGGRVLPAFFDGLEATPELLSKWRAQSNDNTIRAAVWLEENGHDVRPWTKGLGRVTAHTIAQAVQAGLDPAKLKRTMDALKPARGAGWWQVVDPADLAALMEAVEPDRLADMVTMAEGLSAGAAQMFLSVTSLKVFAKACRRGLGPEALRHLLEPHIVAAGGQRFFDHRSFIDVLRQWRLVSQ